jgi:hypothetical protein
MEKYFEDNLDLQQKEYILENIKIFKQIVKASE